MAEQKQDDQLEHTYSSYVRIGDVALLDEPDTQYIAGEAETSS